MGTGGIAWAQKRNAFLQTCPWVSENVEIVILAQNLCLSGFDPFKSAFGEFVEPLKCRDKDGASEPSCRLSGIECAAFAPGLDDDGGP